MSTTTASLFIDNFPSRLPRWTNFILIVAIGWAFAVVSIRLFPAPDVTTVGYIKSIPMNTTNPSVDPSALANTTAGFHMFGAVGTTNIPDGGGITPPVVTKLNLQLTGILAYAIAENAVAIISQGNNGQIAVGIGDTIIEGVTLKDVQKYHVVITNQGVDETIVLSQVQSSR